MAAADNERRIRKGTKGYEYKLKNGEWLTPAEMSIRANCVSRTIANRLLRYTPEVAMGMKERTGTVIIKKDHKDNKKVMWTSREKLCIKKHKRCDNYNKCWASMYCDEVMVDCHGYAYTDQEELEIEYRW